MVNFQTTFLYLVLVAIVVKFLSAIVIPSFTKLLLDDWMVTVQIY